MNEAHFLSHSGGHEQRLNDLEELVCERTKLEQAVKDLEVVGSTLSHDLRSPLRTVRGLLIVLCEDHSADLPPKARAYIDEMKAACDRMDSMITDMLAYGTVASRRIVLEPINVNAAVNAAKMIMEDDLKAKNAVLNIQQDMPYVMGNTSLLTHALANLIGNAVKFTAAGVRPVVSVVTVANNGTVRICVKDNGIGISLIYKDKIFEIFERLHTATEYPGTGVGLAIVKKSAQRMNGLVGFDSALGEGSTFWLELHLADHAAASIDPANAPQTI